MINYQIREIIANKKLIPMMTFCSQLNNNTKKSKIRHIYMTKFNDNERQLTKSMLTLRISTDMFQNNRIRLRCFDEITPVYKGSATIEIYQDGPHTSPHSHRKYIGKIFIFKSPINSCSFGSIFLLKINWVYINKKTKIYFICRLFYRCIV